MQRLWLCLITALYLTLPISTQAEETQTRNPAALKALTDMGRYLQQQKNLHIQTDSTIDRVLNDGQLIQFTHHTETWVARPDRLRIKTSSSTSQQKDFFYDGKTFTLYDPAKNFYASAPAPGTLDKLLTTLSDRYGIELPLADLFHWGTNRAPLDKIQSALPVGKETINGKAVNHYAYRKAKLTGNYG